MSTLLNLSSTNHRVTWLGALVSIALLSSSCAFHSPGGDDVEPIEIDQSAVTAAASPPLPPPVSFPVFFNSGSISCSGATESADKIIGTVTFQPSSERVSFAVNVTDAAPNAAYTLAFSGKPSCAGAVFFQQALTTDAAGAGSFAGSFVKAPGQYDLLTDLGTSPTPTDPTKRELATGSGLTSVIVLPP